MRVTWAACGAFNPDADSPREMLCFCNDLIQATARDDAVAETARGLAERLGPQGVKAEPDGARPGGRTTIADIFAIALRGSREVMVPSPRGG